MEHKMEKAWKQIVCKMKDQVTWSNQHVTFQTIQKKTGT